MNGNGTFRDEATLTVDVLVDDSRVQVGFAGKLNHWPDVLAMQVVAGG